MGFIGNDHSRPAVVDGYSAYAALASGDVAGAWFLLQNVGESDPAPCRYNKALCLLAAGRYEESLQMSRSVFRSLTEGVPQKPFDPTGDVLVKASGRDGPPRPMPASLPSCNPTYAGVQARWLLAVCLLAAGYKEEAASVSSPLERYSIKPVWNGDE